MRHSRSMKSGDDADIGTPPSILEAFKKIEIIFLALLQIFVFKKTSQELRMLSSVRINCQVTNIVMNPGSQLSVL